MSVELRDDEILHGGQRIGTLAYLRRWKLWRWTVGDAVGEWPTREGVVEVVGMFLRAEAER